MHLTLFRHPGQLHLLRGVSEALKLDLANLMYIKCGWPKMLMFYYLENKLGVTCSSTGK